MKLNFKISNNISASKKNISTWTNNLVHFEKSKQMRVSIFSKIDEPLENLIRIPKKSVVVGRFKYLANVEKAVYARCKLIATELISLWTKLSIPSITHKSAIRKVQNLVSHYQKVVVKCNKKNLDDFEVIFNITNEQGIWLSTEDRKFYELQVKSNGEVGYVTNQEAAVHPSKVRRTEPIVKKIETENASYEEKIIQCKDSSDSENNIEYIPPAIFRKRKYQSTVSAVSLVKNVKLSTHQSKKVCKDLSEQGINVSAPTQAGIYKGVMREADKIKENMKITLKDQLWALHFDGKKIDGKEIQVVVLKNNKHEKKLGVLSLTNGKAKTIFDGLCEMLNDFDLWNVIRVIICDTTSVNTGSKGGVVVLLKQVFVEKKLIVPQYIGCQHHVLDLILKHVMDSILEGKSISPNINYFFMEELMKDYNKLIEKFKQSSINMNIPKMVWRDDMRFLWELGHYYRYYIENGKFPAIHFKTLPNLSNARWNSRAILVLLAYILMPRHRPKLQTVCNFITGVWLDIWFSDQYFRPQSHASLSEAVQNYAKAYNSFIKHWKEEDTVIDTARSNICAECGIKCVQEIMKHTKIPENINKRFILSNK